MGTTQIGRTIYYQLSTGNVILDCGERSGSVVATTLQQDFQTYTALQGIQESAVGVIQCDYGYQITNFQTYPYHIDITKNPIDETAIVWDTTNPIGASLTQVQANKIAQITNFYNQALTAGFTTSASGTATQFAYGQSDQTKFMKVLMSMNANLLTYPVTLFAANTSPVQFTQAQLQQLFVDLTTFEMGLETKLHTYIAQIQACATTDAVNAIAWS